jgi:hypothetical protein
MTATQTSALASGFEIRFSMLSNEGRGLVFPCDREGHVDMDALSERSRNNYLFARAMLGRDYATPRVMRSAALT